MRPHGDDPVAAPRDEARNSGPIRSDASTPGRMVELTVDDYPTLQALLDECHDYSLLHHGHPFGPSAARDEFDDLPPGATGAEKFVHGLVGHDEPEGRLIAAVESVRHYPDPSTWWLGLLLVRPDHRNRGVGSWCSRWFEDLVRNAGAQAIALCVVDANPGGLAFWRRQGFELDRIADRDHDGPLRHRLHVLRKQIVANPFDRERGERTGGV